jgi:hypothetical protein
MNNHLRPDEKATNSEIERSQSRDRSLKTLGKAGLTAAGTAIGGSLLGVGSKLASKVMPFLNEYIPAELAMKGINKVSPELGNFLKSGMKEGLDVKEGLNFIKENLIQQSSQEQAKENRNVIEQYSPELHQFIDQEIRKGRNPIEAGTIAQQDKRFSNIINKLSKDHNTPWSNILESVYGGQGMAPNQEQQQPEQRQEQQGQGLDPQLAQIMGGISQGIQKLRGNRG